MEQPGVTGNTTYELQIDALPPAEMAAKAQMVGVKKAQMGFHTLFVLSVLAGAFIALGAIFSTTATAGTAGEIPFGITRIIGGLVFCLGLILVVVGGAELFTGNNLIVMAWASGKVTTRQLLRNWAIVYTGNLVGSVLTAAFMFATKQYASGNGSVGLNALNIARAKTSLDPLQAVALGILCNALVCLAVWLCFSARSTTDKVLSILFPITAFVAAGFEHSIANMYFIPIGLLIKDFASADFWTLIQTSPDEYASLTWTAFVIKNLIPVTTGNIIGGALMVGAVYWFIFLRPKHSSWSSSTAGDRVQPAQGTGK